MGAGFFADLTVDLNDRRSSRTDRWFKRFSPPVRRRFDFLATFLATSLEGFSGIGWVVGGRATRKANGVAAQSVDRVPGKMGTASLRPASR